MRESRSWSLKEAARSRLSDQRLYQLVEETAEQISDRQKELLTESREKELEVRAAPVDLSASEAEEIIWLADGVCVSEQKFRRDKQAKSGKERTTTDLVMMQRLDGSYKTLCAGFGVETVEYYRAEVAREYGEKAGSLPVVVISDGARSIKNEAKKVFGEQVSDILDWYHLQAKICQLMRQIAVNRKAKKESTEILLELLWEGRVEKAIEHLDRIEVKNEAKLKSKMRQNTKSWWDI